MTKKIEDGGLPEDMIDAAASICRGLGIPSNPTNCFPIIEGMKADRQRDQWQPIETAPKDGTVVDLWNATVQERVPNAKFDAGKWKVWWLDGFDGMAWVTAEYQPGLTHWMPLPSPPRALDQKGSSNG